MGVGDTLMAMGEARKLHAQTHQPVLICGRDGRPLRSDLFRGVPYIIDRPPRDGAPHQRLYNAPGIRPYIASKTPERWTWRRYKPTPAEIVFTPEELAFAEPYRGAVMVEPYGKAIGHRNKMWPLLYWQQLDTRIHLETKWPVVQCGPAGTRPLLYAEHVPTPTFRQALAVLSVCRAFVGTEGGLMHGAAAVGTPAVIIWSEFISPEITGYGRHTNLRKAGAPCGSRQDCQTCAASMYAIQPREAFDALALLLKGEAPHG